jgi:hypothetical protein
LKSQTLAKVLSSAKEVEDVEAAGSEKWEVSAPKIRDGEFLEETNHEDVQCVGNSPGIV